MITPLLSYADQIVDPAALELFHRTDAEVYDHPARDASDHALLRYLAMRAVGLHTVGFSDREQIPWSMDPEEQASWERIHRYVLDGACERLTKTWDQDVASLDKIAHAKRRYAERAARRDLDAQVPRWKAFHTILTNAQCSFVIGKTFDPEMFLLPLSTSGRYTWNAEEQMGSSFRGRSFINPVVAAQWLRDHREGFSGFTMHDSGLHCPEGNVYVSENDHGTSKWAQLVLAKIEQAELRLTTTAAQPVLNEIVRPRL